MKRHIIVPAPPMAHPSDPAWDCVGDVIELDDEDVKCAAKQIADHIDQRILDDILAGKLTEEEEMTTKTEILEPTPLIVRKVYLPALLKEGVPEGAYATIPWKDWCLLVTALHRIGICLPPLKEEE